MRSCFFVPGRTGGAEGGECATGISHCTLAGSVETRSQKNRGAPVAAPLRQPRAEHAPARYAKEQFTSSLNMHKIYQFHLIGLVQVKAFSAYLREKGTRPGPRGGWIGPLLHCKQPLSHSPL